MVDILKHTNLSEDGIAIGETQLAWIPDVMELIINQQEGNSKTALLLQRLPSHKQAEFIEDILLSYSQFKSIKEGNRGVFSSSQSTLDDYIRSYIRSYSNDYDGYLSYVQNSKHKLAQFFFRWFSAKLPSNNVHTYIVGGSGSGKSTKIKKIIKERILKKKSSVIVLDPKGDLARDLVKWNVNYLNLDDIIYFDPFLFEDLTPVINPFDIGTDNPKSLTSASFELRETFDMILSDIDGGFTPRMKNILGHTLSIVLKQKGSLSDLYRFFNNSNNQDLLQAGKTSTDEQERQFFNYEFEEISSDTIAGISARLGLLLQNKFFRDMTTGKSTINLAQAIRDKKTIIFNLSKGAVTRDYSKFFGKIILSLVLLQAMYNANSIEDEHKRPKIDLFIDEFQNYITPAVGEIVAEARAYGIRLYVATQLVGQDMSKALENLILTNTDTKIVGWSSIENRAVMARQFGMTADQLETSKHTFWVRIANGKPFKVKSSSLFAGNNNAMTDDEWATMLEHQKQYYRHKIQPKESTEAPPKDFDANNEFTQQFKPKFDL